MKISVCFRLINKSAFFRDFHSRRNIKHFRNSCIFFAKKMNQNCIDYLNTRKSWLIDELQPTTRKLSNRITVSHFFIQAINLLSNTGSLRVMGTFKKKHYRNGQSVEVFNRQTKKCRRRENYSIAIVYIPNIPIVSSLTKKTKSREF